MRVSVKFLGHIIDRHRVAVDTTKVKVISEMSKADLMKGDGFTTYVRRIKSSEDALGMHSGLGMAFYYQHFIPNCSSIAKPLFALATG